MTLKKNTSRTLILLPLLIFMTSGCTISKALKLMYSKKVKPKYEIYEEKSIVLIPLVHLGKPEFYASLHDTIVSRKNKGYTVYYELITVGETDSLERVQTIRKYRRLFGDLNGPERMKKVFKKLIVQPDYEDLGTDSTDVHADITAQELINEYERLLGRIELDSCDIQTPIEEYYDCSNGIITKKMNKHLIIDFRNENAIDMVINSESNKIVILYGAGHIKGMRKLLRAK